MFVYATWEWRTLRMATPGSVGPSPKPRRLPPKNYFINAALSYKGLFHQYSFQLSSTSVIFYFSHIIFKPNSIASIYCSRTASYICSYIGYAPWEWRPLGVATPGSAMSTPGSVGPSPKPRRLPPKNYFSNAALSYKGLFHQYCFQLSSISATFYRMPIII